MVRSASSSAGQRAVLIITDGLGYSYETQQSITAELMRDAKIGEHVTSLAEQQMASYRNLPVGADALAQMALYPISAEAITEQVSGAEAVGLMEAIKSVKLSISDAARVYISKQRQKLAAERDYIPWMAQQPGCSDLRNDHLTIPTFASGKWAGLDDTTPPINGNSDTGHQQIGSFVMRPQISRSISDAIDDGSFFTNASLLGAIRAAAKNGKKVNFCILLSGVSGNDGIVHSSWKHLEAFLKLLFETESVAPSRVRMLAILDGRDSLSDSSIQTGADGGGDYLGKLDALLKRYNAAESLAWVIGRNYAMDRDYQEHNAAAVWDLLLHGKGQPFSDAAELRAAVGEHHRAGQLTDCEIPALVRMPNGGGREAGGAAISAGDAFVNLNFRADRACMLTALLTGNKQFLQEKITARNRSWSFKWYTRAPAIQYCCLTEYDPALSLADGVSVAFERPPAGGSLLAAHSRSAAASQKYLLVGESIKSAHVGYFIRCCREEAYQNEDRTVFSSRGQEYNITSDSEIYREPAMRMPDIAAAVCENMGADSAYNLIVCNLAAPDMVGHLLPKRKAAALEAYELTNRYVLEIADAALKAGWAVVWTSDHGNIEENNPSHTANEVLTTVATPTAAYKFAEMASFRAKLFDISHALAHILSIDTEPAPGENLQQGTVGRSFIEEI